MDIGHASQIAKNQKVLLTILSNLRFLGRQANPLRGDGSGLESNFQQLLCLCALENPHITEWLKRKTDTYTSPEIQNELLKIMSLQVLREIAKEMQASSFFSLMADETTDCSNHSQLVIVIRWVQENLEVFEDFIGLNHMERINASSIVAALKDVLMRMNLSTSRMRGQCYDGCSTMTGAKKGVVKSMKEEAPRSIFVHCYGHALNLAVSNAVKANTVLRNARDITHEITKLVKLLPKRDLLFKRIKSELAVEQPGLRILCPTRWTVRADALKGILDNYEALQELWMEAAAVTSDTETKARLAGVASQMMSFDFFFGCSLGEAMLHYSDILSKSLQTSNLSVVDGQKNAKRTIDTLQSLRNDKEFDTFWKDTL